MTYGLSLGAALLFGVLLSFALMRLLLRPVEGTSETEPTLAAPTPSAEIERELAAVRRQLRELEESTDRRFRRMSGALAADRRWSGTPAKRDDDEIEDGQLELTPEIMAAIQRNAVAPPSDTAPAAAQSAQAHRIVPLHRRA